MLGAVMSVAAAPPVDTMTGIYDDNIKTLQVSVDGNAFAPPIAVLGTDQCIRISFDCLADDRDYFRYSLVHCNADWQPSGLVDSEFVDGFNEGIVENYDFSRGTTVHYVHYELTVPDAQMQPLVSGNYLLKLYREDNPDEIVLQCRFMLSENTAMTAVQASPQTDIDYNKKHQQLSIMVDTEHTGVEDPFNDLTIVVGQNGRLDSERMLKQPLRMQGRKVIYEHLPALIFEAGNEYRRFEVVSNQYPGMGVEQIDYFDPYYHYGLYVDQGRADDAYSYDQTQHGRFVVREYNSDDSDIEADYGVVHFALDYPNTSSAMIFLDGDFTLRRFDDNARMVFNPSSGMYERAMLLKQGAYNYQYLIVPPGAKRGFTDAVEGDKYQTVNEYNVRVYHRRRGERYDRLIGTASCFTNI